MEIRKAWLVACASLAAMTVGVAAAPSAAYAQDAQRQAASDDGTTLGDVVVTARRREERLQDVPVAVTALSGESLVARGVVSVQDLAKTTPGLNIVPSSRGGDSPFVTLRGQRVVDTSLLLYVAHRHGYRSGGVQNRATTEASATPFKPEIVNDVELGVKFDKRLSDDISVIFNADVYHGKYTGLQRSVGYISPVNGTIVTAFFNVASARIQGVEAEGTLRVGKFEFGANVGYTDAKYNKYEQTLASGAIQDLSSLPLGLVPEWTTQLRASYSQPLSHQDESITGAVMYQSVSKLFASESFVTLGAFLPGYHTWDAKLTWANVGGKPIDLSALMTNFTDEKYYPYATNYTSSFGMALRFPAPPRRFEINAAYRC